MAEKNADQIKALYTELAKIAPSQDWDRILKISKKILGFSIYETKAFQCKIVCLIHLDKFDEALTSIERSTDVNKLSFEKAYCEYRLNKIEEAYATLQKCTEMTVKEKELLAQVCYRMEKYSESYDSYRDIVKNIDDDFDNERQANLSAVVASWRNSSQTSKDLDMSENEKKSYELCYNSACISLAKGNYEEAREKLLRAETMCKETFEDNPEDQEGLDNEIAIIRVQLAFCLQKLGLDDESLKIYNSVMKNKPADLSVNAVASNNLVCLNKDQNVFDSKKRIKAATAAELDLKLNSMQRKVIAYNEILFSIVTNQKETVKKLLDQYLDKFDDKERFSLLQMSQLCKDKKYSEAEKLLKECIGTAATSKLIRYYLVQVLLFQGKLNDAISQFKTLDEFKTYKLGIISAIITILKKTNDKTEISNLLSNAVEYFTKTNLNAKELEIYIKENSNFQIESGNFQKACEMLEKLRALKPKDFKILSKLINVYSKFDSDKANKLSKDLPSLEEISANSTVDIDLLENQFSLLSSKYSKLKTGQIKSPDLIKSKGEKTDAKTKLKKKKKVKLPKNYDPNVPLDPERWMPLRERSYYRGKRNKKKQTIGKGTQGAVSSAKDAATPQSPKPAQTPDSERLGDKLKGKPSAAANLKKKKKGGQKW